MIEGTLLLAKEAYLTGWAVAAPIGPVNLEIMRRSLRVRLLAGFLVGLGAVTIDVCYLTIFSLGLGAVLEIDPVRRLLFLAGGGFLVLLGVLAARDGVRYLRSGTAPRLEVARPAGPSPSLWRHYAVGLGMTATNPMTIAFWSALALRFAHLPWEERLVTSAAVFCGCLSWVVTLMIILRFARRWVGPRLFGVATLAGGAALLWFGARFVIAGFAGGM